MKTPRLHLVCGLPGAGKTTRSKQIIASTHAVHLCADEWVVGLGKSLVDYEFRMTLQECLLAHAATLLRAGLSVVIEFGSWSRRERETIRVVAVREKALTELHFLNAPIHELAARVRDRGGPDVQALSNVLLQDFGKFEQPSTDEILRFDRYFGPADEWTPA